MELVKETDLLTTCWRDDVWLSQSALTAETALRDYFSLSTFYDPQCNNETVKNLNLPPSELHSLAPGAEYVLISASEPDLFVIKKQFRSEKQEVTPLAYYYILSGTIYQAPDLYSIVQSKFCDIERTKVKRCQFLLDKSFDIFSKLYDPLTHTQTEMEMDEAKQKLGSQRKWEKLKTATDILNAVFSK